VTMVRNVLLIAGRELRAMVGTMSGWVILAAFLVLDGLAFNVFALAGVRRSGDVLFQFFYWSSGLTAVAAVFLSMRLLAEERQVGTLPLLYASPVEDLEIVLGKFLAALTFLWGMAVLTVYMPLLILVHGKVSLGHLAAGYLGLFLVGSASLALGTLASALSRTPIVAAVLGGSLLGAMVLAWNLARISEPPFAGFFAALAIFNLHFVPFQSGVIHVRDVAYYLLVTWVFLFAATRVVEARRWR
jgi:ABC-2 type transport system permease protein